MSTKMCNECKQCDGDFCNFFEEETDRESTIACILFEPKNPTNADIIRQMSNRELAELITPKVMFCNGCPVKCAEKDIPPRDNNDPFGADVAGDVCIKRVEQWLESEVEDE